MNLICNFCRKEYTPKYKYGKSYLVKRLFCSRECYKRSGLQQKTFFKKGHKPLLNQWNEKNCQWKGNKVGYFALHTWISKRLGQKEKCEFCGITNKKRKLVWANLFHNYKRNLEDWVSLCHSCHRRCDLFCN